MRPLLRALPVLVLCAVLLAACGFNTRAAEPLRLAYNIWPGFGPLYAAETRNYYAPTTVEIRTFSSSYDAYRAFIGGDADVLGTTLFEMLRMLDEGVPVRAIAVNDYSNGADGVVGRAGLTRMADLKGKQVGVEIGTINHFILLLALQQAGLSESDVTLVNLPVDASAKALSEGKLDAAALYDPYLSEQIRAGSVKLFSSTEVPGLVPSVLVAHTRVVEERGAAVRDLLRGREQALHEWQHQPQSILSDMATPMRSTPEQLQADLGGLVLVNAEQQQQIFDQASAQALIKAYTTTATFMNDRQLLNHSVPRAEDVIDGRFAVALHKEASR